MKIVVRFTDRQEQKALPVLLRHSPGMVLPQRTYVLDEDVVKQLKEKGIRFTEISREMEAPSVEDATSGERV